MTTELRVKEIRLGDLVQASKYHPHNPGEVFTAITDTQVVSWNWSDWFTRIGHPDDGWRVHTGSECPVGADERVEVFFKVGAKGAGCPASEWDWDQEQGTHTIVAYRVVSTEPEDERPTRLGDTVALRTSPMMRGRVHGVTETRAWIWWQGSSSPTTCRLDQIVVVAQG